MSRPCSSLFRQSGAILFIALAGYARAQIAPSSQTVTFGMAGLAANQVARLNVLNPAVLAGPSACSAEVSFLDSQGTVLKTDTFQIREGTAAFLDLDWSEVNSSADRIQIRATLKTTQIIAGPPPQGPAASVCALFPTLELFDKDTGKTTILVSDSRPVPVPIPATPGPAARLNESGRSARARVASVASRRD